MQWLSLISVKRPVFATVLILVLVVIGIVGKSRLGVDKFPKVDFPMIIVLTPYPGASPAAVETDVTLKVEEAVNTVSGLDSLASNSTEGVSMVIAQFSLEVDPDKAAQTINERLASIQRDLPPGLRPEVRRADPDSAPILVLAVKGPPGTTNRELTRFADKQIKQRIERLKDVGQVVVLGGTDRQINIDIDSMRLAASGVSALEVFRAVQVGNANQPSGAINTGPTRSTLRVEGRAQDPNSLGGIVIRQQGQHAVKIADVANIEDAAEDADSSAGRNGEPAIALSIRKQSGTNTVAVVDRIRAEVTELQNKMPAGYSVDVVRDNSEQIRTSVSQVLEHLVLGALLAALIVLLFLGSVRSTVIAAIAIPVSIVSTFGLMMIAGLTLNLMTLLALALAVGIVIDDAIVVLENIYRHIDEKRMKPFPAAIHATKEIGLAVLATTLSLMAVFLPVAFMSGIVGKFLFSFGITMAFAIAVSLIVAFTLTPMLAARLLQVPPPEGQERSKGILERISDFIYRPIQRVYLAILAFCLRRRWVVGIAIFSSCASLGVTMKQIGGDFIPPNDEAQFEIYIQAPEATTLEATTVIAERIARRTRDYPEVTSTLVTIADDDRRSPNIGRVYVRLSDPEKRARSQFDVMDLVRKEVLSQVDKSIRVAAQPVNDFSVGGQNAVVSYVISGPDLDKLQLYGQRVLKHMKEVPGVADLDSSLLDPVDETMLHPNLERAALLGVDPGDIANTLTILIGGVSASTFEDRGDQYAVFMRAAERFRNDPAALRLLTVPSRTVGQVRLFDVVSLGSDTATSKISRQSRERAVFITMNNSPGFSEQTLVDELEKAMKALDMPPGYTYEPFGRSKEMAKMKGAFMFAIFLSFVFMYLVLAAQFESWLYPFIIMLSLPLTLPFAIISLLLTGGSLNIFSMLGLIVLFAMVKKNAILQVDHANALRRQGLPRTEAVLAASRDRLRPILMTTFAFVAGMLPLVTSQGIGSGFSKAMASIVVGGQILSLLLTLVAIPVIYTWFDDLARINTRVWNKVLRRSSTGVDRGAAEVGVIDIHA